MALVSFKRGLEASIKALGTNKTAVDGTFYVATDTSTLWLGQSDGTLMQIKDNILNGMATSSLAGLMSASDYTKLQGITASADAVSFSRSLTSGTKVGTITINGTGTDLYAPTNTNTTYSLTQDATDGHKITLTPSSGTAQTITIPDNNTHKTWGLSISGHTVSIVDGGTTKSVTVPDNDTKYTLAGLGGITPAAVDDKIKTAVASAYKYKGSVDTEDDLPTTGQVTGDVYNIVGNSSYGRGGMNVAWNGDSWDALGSNVDLSNYVTTSDSRLSNARPASDVYSWAKASTKPSYSASEISGLGNLATKSTNASTTQFLRGDGTWATPAYPSVSNATITVKQTGKADQTFSLNGGAATISLNDNNTWTALKGATATTDGGAGYVAAPTKGQQNYVLHGDGTWVALPTSLPASGGTATNVSGVVAIANGGTGASTAAGARTNLGLGSLATKNSLTYTDVNADRSGSASTAEKNAKDYVDSSLTWGEV